MNKTYLAIDLKSFYASVECVARKLNPMTTNLVVADESRTDKTICLAVTPSLKAYGIGGRARLWEVKDAVKKINSHRFSTAFRKKQLTKDSNGVYRFSSSSYDANALADNPSMELSFIIAPPQMKLYEEISTKIFSIYMNFVSAEDIYVYSIDECFIDLTSYLKTYNITAHKLAEKMIKAVLNETGITATAGIGTNLYLCKVAMDIVAKHVTADKYGVRIAELNEQTYRETLWCHTPLTDFWNVGHGIANRLKSLGCYTMGDIARLSIANGELIYKLLGIKAELVIDHAWGYEPVELADIKQYHPQSNSLSSGQVLKEPYDTDKARLIVQEMTELLVLDMVRKGIVTKKLTLTINYDKDSIMPLYANKKQYTVYDRFKVAKTGFMYNGKLCQDRYGRIIPCHSHGTGNLDKWSSSSKKIVKCMTQLYDRIINSDLLVRQVNICACNVIYEENIPDDTAPKQLELFVDYDEVQRMENKIKIHEEKEKALQKSTLRLQDKFGKNAVLKGINLMEGAMTVERNGQIGGHRA